MVYLLHFFAKHLLKNAFAGPDRFLKKLVIYLYNISCQINFFIWVWDLCLNIEISYINSVFSEIKFLCFKCFARSRNEDILFFILLFACSKFCIFSFAVELCFDNQQIFLFFRFFQALLSGPPKYLITNGFFQEIL